MHGKGHAREIAEGVAHKDARGVSVVGENGEGDAEEGKTQERGEDVRRQRRRAIGRFNDIGRDDGYGDDGGLARLESVDSRVNVDGIRGEGRKQSHVDHIIHTQFEYGACCVGVNDGEV